jgi:hypothetical protein
LTALHSIPVNVNVTCVILQITFCDTNGYNTLQLQPYFTAHHCINTTVWFCLGVSMEMMSTNPFFSGPIDIELITMLFVNKTIQMLRNPGRFAPITCSPRKVSRFAPLNRYYITIDEVFFNNFLVIIYLLLVCKKK